MVRDLRRRRLACCFVDGWFGLLLLFSLEHDVHGFGRQLRRIFLPWRVRLPVFVFFCAPLHTSSCFASPSFISAQFPLRYMVGAITFDVSISCLSSPRKKTKVETNKVRCLYFICSGVSLSMLFIMSYGVPLGVTAQRSVGQSGTARRVG
jgi:hypothetical protein